MKERFLRYSVDLTLWQVPDAYGQLERAVRDGARLRYGLEPDAAVTARIDHELAAIRERDLANNMLFLHRLYHTVCHNPGVRVMTLTNLNALAVSYCLGLSPLDPIACGFDATRPLVENLYCADFSVGFRDFRLWLQPWLEKLGDKGIAPVGVDADFGEKFGLCFRLNETSDFIGQMVDNASRLTGHEIDPDRIPLDDAATYEAYGDGTIGNSFVFSDTEWRQWLHLMQQQTFEDLMTAAACRDRGDGGRDLLLKYMERKQGGGPTPAGMPQCLRATHGLLFYQDQVMQIVRDMAGYTDEESNAARKAFGKKLVDKITLFKADFFSRGRRRGHTDAELADVWQLCSKDARHTLRKSWVGAQAYDHYRCAWLKVHYPAAYSEFEAGTACLLLARLYCSLPPGDDVAQAAVFAAGVYWLNRLETEDPATFNAWECPGSLIELLHLVDERFEPETSVHYRVPRADCGAMLQAAGRIFDKLDEDTATFLYRGLTEYIVRWTDYLHRPKAQ